MTRSLGETPPQSTKPPAQDSGVGSLTSLLNKPREQQTGAPAGSGLVLPRGHRAHEQASPPDPGGLPALPGQAPVQGAQCWMWSCPLVWQPPGLCPGLLTEIRKTFTPWSSVSMAVMRMLFSLALSICIWAHSLVLRISRRLPWVRITATNEDVSPACTRPQPHKNRHTCRKVNIPGRNPTTVSHMPVCRAAALAPPPLRCMQWVEVVPGRGSPG